MCLVAFQKIFRKIFSGVWKRRRKTQIQKNTSHTTQKKLINNNKFAIDGAIAISRRRDRDRRIFLLDLVIFLDGSSSRISRPTYDMSQSRISEIAPSIARLRRRRDHDRDLGLCRRSRSRSRIAIDGAVIGLNLSSWMIFFWVVACVFLNLCFPSSFPNTRKYFPENFLKCNQTPWKHFPFPEISISGKYVFSGKRFTATKHSLSEKKGKKSYVFFSQQ